MSHLACSDEPGHPLNRGQAETFAAFAARLPGVRLSLAATGGILLGEAFHFGLARPGVGLYGGLPFAAARPVVRLACRSCKSATSLPARPSATAPPGAPTARLASPPSPRYADGFLRASAAAPRAFRRRQPCRSWAGSPWTSSPSTSARFPRSPGPLVILNATPDGGRAAAAAGTIGHEILTSLGPRYHRVYKEAAPTPDPASSFSPRRRLSRLDAARPGASRSRGS